MHIDGRTNSEALTAAGGTPPSGPRIAQSSRDLEFLSSDGGSRERPFVPADAAGGKSGTVTARRANRKAEPGLEVGASQTPGSSMSFGLAKPIIAGQASSPSDSFQFAGHRSSRPANLPRSLPAFSSTVALLKAIDIAEALTDSIGNLLLFLFIITVALSTPVVLWALLFLDLG
jgi:hypothetical protein